MEQPLKPEPQIQEVDEATLRHYYNNIGEFEARVERGELLERIMPGSDRPAPADLREPAGTRSRIVQLFELGSGRLVAKVHEYRRADGSLGASGKRDPKWILRADGGVLKQVRKKRS